MSCVVHAQVLDCQVRVNADLIDQTNTQVFETLEKELNEFVDSLTFPQMEQLGAYFDDMPKVYMDVDFTCSCGKEQSRTMEGLQSFF